MISLPTEYLKARRDRGGEEIGLLLPLAFPPSRKIARRRWAKLDAILEGRHPLSRTANIEGVLVDIVSIYLVARADDALHEALTAFAKRHPKKRALATKMRAYARDWIARRAPIAAG